MTKVERSMPQRYLAWLLLKVPSMLGAQGESWVKFYDMLGVEREKVIVIRNWLPEYFLISRKKSCLRCKMFAFYFCWMDGP